MAPRRSSKAAPSATQKAEWAAAREAKLGELQQRLVDEVAKLTDGQQWRAWLEFAANFHTYSFGNTVLIYAQRPDATWVAGVKAWNELGRHVRKGEQGIAILAPITGRKKTDETPGDGRQPTATPDPADPGAGRPGEPDPSPGGQDPDPAGDDQPRGIRGFRVVHVFDLSQTDGDPIDAPARPLAVDAEVQLLAGEAPPGVWDALQEMAQDRGYTVERGDCGSANGYIHYGDSRVRIRADVDDAQAVKTLIHEVGGHMMLHEPADFGFATTADCRGEREVEAESVAFLVAAHHGLDTSGYSFGYVTGWAQQAAAATGKTPEEIVRATGQRVIKTAFTVIEATDAVLGAVEAAPQPELAERVSAGVTRTTAVRERAETAAAGLSPAPAPAAVGEQAALFDLMPAGRTPAAAFPPLDLSAGATPAADPQPGTTARTPGRRR